MLKEITIKTTKAWLDIQDDDVVPVMLQHEVSPAPLSWIRDANGNVPVSITNFSFFEGNKWVIGLNQGDVKDDTHIDGDYIDLKIFKDGSYKIGNFKSWEYRKEHGVVFGGSFACLLIKDGQDVEEYSSSIVSASRLSSLFPQTAVGFADGKWFRIVTGGYGVNGPGVSTYDIRQFVRSYFNKVEFLGIADGGGSSELIVNGKIINKPTDGKERNMFNGMAFVKKNETGLDPDPEPAPKPEQEKGQKALLSFRDYQGVEMMSGITQGQGIGTHILLPGANDFNGRAAWDRVDLLAPYDCVVKAIGSYDNTVLFESLGPVKTPSGTFNNCWFMCAHILDVDMKILDIKVGKIFKQGEPCYTEGYKGIGSGNHIHIESGIGTAKKDAKAPYYKSSDTFVYNGKTYTQYYPNIDGQEKPIQEMFFLKKGIDYKDAKSALDLYDWKYDEGQEVEPVPECQKCKEYEKRIVELEAIIKNIKDEAAKA